MSADYRKMGILLAVLVAVILVGALLSGTIGPGMMWPGMMGPGMMWGYGSAGTAPTAGGWTWGLGMAFGMLAMLAFWAALVIGIVLLVRWGTSRSSGGPDQMDAAEPLAILRRRYAAGEIDQPTYERMKQELVA